MSKNQKRRCRGAQHFWELCERNGIAEGQVRQDLDEWLESGGHGRAIRTNILRFLDGPARKVGPTIKRPLTDFCKQKLGIEVEDTEFERSDFKIDYFGDFADKNKYNSSLLDGICGDYNLFRPRNKKGTLAIIDAPDKMVAFRVRIFPQGAGHYAFTFGGCEPNDGRWAGYVLCRDNFIYLAGAEQDGHSSILSMILAPLDRVEPFGSVLTGMQMMMLSHSVEAERRETVVARAVALSRVDGHAPPTKPRAKKWQEYESMAKNWLLDQQAKARAGVMIDLRRSKNALTEER